MKKLLYILLAAALLLAMAGCGGGAQNGPPPTESGKLRVIATTFPAYDFARAAGGEHIELSMLIRPGAESHSFEPTSQDIIEIGKADVFVYIGGESEAWVGDILEAAGGEAKAIALVDYCDLLAQPAHEGHNHAGADDEHDYWFDEHVWTSPKNAEKMVLGLAQALAAFDEPNAEAYLANAQGYADQLQQLDAAFAEAAENAQVTTLVFAGRYPFRYLFEDIGLGAVAAFDSCGAQGDPSAAVIATLIDYVNQNNISVVFDLEFSSGTTAETICEATGATPLMLCSGHNVTKQQFDAGETYVDIMYQNLEAMKEAMNP